MNYLQPFFLSKHLYLLDFQQQEFWHFHYQILQSLFLDQQRGKAVIDARGASSATSAAKAALDTVIACENATSSDDCFSAAVYSDGAYDVPEGIMCGFPLMTTPSGEIEIIRDLTLSDNARSRLSLSVDELLSEREAVKDLL